MSSVSFSALFVLPVLFLISIPLILSATITICFSILALFIRLSIIYIELCYALIVSYFVIPTTTSTSLLNFAASEPTTPTSNPSKTSSILALPKSPSFPQFLAPSESHSSPRLHRRTSSISSDPQRTNGPYRSHRQRGKPYNGTAFVPSAALLGLISGDEGRDFEGLGGWRCPASSKHRGSSASSSSGPSISDDTDERAWLSINNRLELPSQPLPIGTSEPLLTIPNGRQQPQMAASPGGRHHRRSVTTSMLTSTPRPRGGKGGSSIALSTRPDHSTPRDAGFEPWSPAATASSPHPTLPEPLTMASSAPHTANAHFSTAYTEEYGIHGSNDGSYFALRRPISSGAHASGTTTPQTTISVDDADRVTNASSGGSGRLMAHYHAGVRFRRRSISGPNSAKRPGVKSEGTV